MKCSFKSSQLIVLSLALCVCFVQARLPDIPDEDWNYVTVRPGAHLFWWLYGSLNENKPRYEQPLILWLQGGPGGSSTGFGNFFEIGPLDTELKPREATWAKLGNLIFVDNPVGTGYSYVEDPSLYTQNEDQIAADLVTLFQSFFDQYQILQSAPFYIFSESYGGKMASVFARELVRAINSGNITTNFQGVALGDSWIKPIAFVEAWAPYLLATSEIDDNGFVQIQKWANYTRASVDNENWEDATQNWGNTEEVVEAVSDGVDFYNILNRKLPDPIENPKITSLFKNKNSLRALQRFYFPKSGSHFRKTTKNDENDLPELMNGPIKKKLKIIPDQVTWGGQADQVFLNLEVDFMQSVVQVVDELILLAENATNSNSTAKHLPFKIVVYSGNLDLICCTPGTLAWIDELKWPSLPRWKNAERQSIVVGNELVAFVKSYSWFSFWTILSAGHMVPNDSPQGGLELLRQVTDQ